jgi:hypothetical protein
VIFSVTFQCERQGGQASCKKRVQIICLAVPLLVTLPESKASHSLHSPTHIAFRRQSHSWPDIDGLGPSQRHFEYWRRPRSQDDRRPAEGADGRILYFNKRSVEPAVLSCSKAHSRISSVMLPSLRLSRAANSSSSVRRACRTRRLICAFHSPIPRSLAYAAQNSSAIKRG